ncbi:MULTISPECIES: precorrin-2 dehydrogenase/sirohydrochlorin ferrochelatase family protein [Enterococcus]|uniref:precorrin-2 dehydrogenase n=1 Tax=Candidatus Enterococcus ferrettii TaxID=2815324 RepID=A0ABV0EQ97_9ENTE|nr:bifunctional precorrin-2 dehydrogenase/sirohydrochlorin ferrochelatase [Enterococcus sp. 665A]MBO1339105.1 bifunctional precorrin-2 dehydrogenase/sirohydrochlorin ferrochelatase [Enterococcus sp. 665A]
MYPILIKLSRLDILVIGGGKIATRKIKGLVEEGGRPVVVAAEATDTLVNLEKAGKIILQRRPFQAGDTKGFQLIFICTDNEAVNQQILQETTPQQLVNDTTKQSRSNFFNMALVKEGDVGVAITTGGKSPEKSKKLRTAVQAFLKSLAKS